MNSDTIVTFNKTNVKNYNISVPNEQRILDDDNIANIVNYQLRFYQKNKCFNFLGCICLNTVDNKAYSIIDGQHRYFSFLKLIEKGFSPSIHAQIIKINDNDDLIENYSIINKNTPLPDFDNSYKVVVELTYKYFLKKYPKIFKSSMRPQRPYINKNMFQSAIAFIEKKLNVGDHEKIIEIIESRNSLLLKWDKSNFPKYRTITENMLKICQENQFCLGLYGGKIEDYCYNWTKEIVSYHTGSVFSSVRDKKQKIPQTKRKIIWEKYMGNKMRELCFCCKKNEITSFGFHCGHIKSEADGGTMDIDNMRPICGSCNSSMGTQNMKEFMRVHFPKNLSYFDSFKMSIFS
tara:strand:+ start:2483 stop:3526 length:1044 start_codon:yes stop_codon:yes gene_type:complete